MKLSKLEEMNASEATMNIPEKTARAKRSGYYISTPTDLLGVKFMQFCQPARVGCHFELVRQSGAIFWINRPQQEGQKKLTLPTSAFRQSL
jgi:hypothetical protein